MTLKTAAKCALIDLVDLYKQGSLDDWAMMRTLVSLYDALKEEGENVSKYELVAENMRVTLRKMLNEMC